MPKNTYKHDSGSIILGNLVIVEYNENEEGIFAKMFQNRIEFDKWLDEKNITSNDIDWNKN